MPEVNPADPLYWAHEAARSRMAQYERAGRFGLADALRPVVTYLARVLAKKYDLPDRNTPVDLDIEAGFAHARSIETDHSPLS